MPHPVDSYVGKRLNQARVAAGFSQEALANAVGITFQQVQKYQKGSNRMGASRLYEFSRVLKVPVSYFFEGYEGYAETPPLRPGGMAEEAAVFEHAPEDSMGRETLELVRSYRNIKDAGSRKAVGTFVRSLAKGSAFIQD